MRPPKRGELPPQEALRPWSVVIPTYGRTQGVAACVGRLLDAPLPRGSEVLVVEQDSPEETAAALARNYPDGPVQVLGASPPSASRGRNVGAAEARHAWILFLDDDCILSPGFFAHAQYYLETYPRLKAMTPSADNPMASGRTWRMGLLDLLGAAPLDGRIYAGHHLKDAMVDAPTPVESCGAGGLAVRREVLDAGLRFDETYARTSFSEDLCFTRLVTKRWRDGLCKLPNSIAHARSPVARMPRAGQQRASCVYRIATCYSISDGPGIAWRHWAMHALIALARSRRLLGAPRALAWLWRAAFFAWRKRSQIRDREFVLGAYAADGILVRGEGVRSEGAKGEGA